MSDLYTASHERSDRQNGIISCPDLSKDICVTASAGSGKTTVMVDRLLYMLERDPSLTFGNILVITFGEKAANTLKERTRAELERRALAAKGKRRKRYESLLAGLQNSYIGTIHSFAARILRENPLEAGVEPGFGVVTEGIDSLLQDRAIERVFDRAAGDDALVRFLVEYRDSAPGQALKGAYAKARSFEIDIGSISVPDMSAGCDAVLAKFLAKARELAALGPGDGKSSRVADTCEKARELCGILEAAATGALDERLVERILGCFGNGGIHGGVKSPWKEAVKELKEGKDGGIVYEAVAALYEQITYPYKAAFVRLLKEFAREYEEEKRRERVLDFDDLLYYLAGLLKEDTDPKKAAAAGYRAAFRHVMVDEFQDTSRIQIDIVRGCARDGQLFIVGDEKQSIYRFRNADLGSFREMVAAFDENSYGRGKAQSFELHENFRSRAHLVRFADFAFADIMGGLYKKVAPMAAYPDEKSCVPRIEIIGVAGKPGGEGDPGEDVLSGDPNTQAGPAPLFGREAEADQLARRIRRLVEGAEVKVKENAGDGRYTLRPAGYKDIAILFKAMSDSYLYENALAAAGIPYFVVKGGDFYGRAEVRDCLNFLKSLDDRSDDLSLAGLLKSPFAGVSDDTVFCLRDPVRRAAFKKEGRRLPSLYDELGRCAGGSADGLLEQIPEDEKARLTRFLEAHRIALAMKDSHPVSAILERAVAESGFDIKLLSVNDGKRKYANVRKLVEKAREFERNQFFTMGEFIRYIEKLRDEEVRESDAQVELERGDNSVRLCTVHRAKGLEFPVVVFADLGREFNDQNDSFVLFGRQGGSGGGECEIGFKYRSRIDGEMKRDRTYALCAERDGAEEKEELQRLFYVGVTRAMDHLILSGVTGKWADDPGKLAARPYAELNSFMKWAVKLKHLYDGRSQEGAAFGFSFDWWSGAGENAPIADETVRLGVSDPAGVLAAQYCGKTGEYQSLMARADAKRQAIVSRIDDIAAREHVRDMRFAVTPLLEYRECPRRYFRSVELRDPGIFYQPKEREEDLGGGDEAVRLRRNELGDLFHLMMERFDFASSDRVREVERLAGRFAANVSQADRDEISEMLRRFAASPLFDEIAASARVGTLYRETDFVIREGGRVLRGTIDLLFKTPQGWTILDYKTNRVDEAGAEAKARYYDLQLLVYASAVKKIAGETPARLLLYFAAPGVVKEVAVTPAVLAKAEAAVADMQTAIAAGLFPGCGRGECPVCSDAVQQIVL